MSYIFEELNAEGVQKIVDSARADPLCEVSFREQLEYLSRYPEPFTNHWSFNGKVGNFLVYLPLTMRVEVSSETYAACIAGRVYRIRTIDYHRPDIYFSDSNPPSEDIRPNIEAEIISAFAAYAGKDVNNPYYKRIFVGRPYEASPWGVQR